MVKCSPGRRKMEESKIKVVDSIMGSGKTQAAIELMNSDTESNYIFITPYLKEIERIKKSCPKRKFYDPINKYTSKLNSLHQLLSSGKNIATTHALFQRATEVTKDLIKLGNYKLILDEVFNVVEELNLGKDDLPTLLEQKLVSKSDDGYLLWNPDKEDYDGKYNDIKNMCMNKNLMFYQNTVLMWVFPVEVFKSFKEVYILTYLFGAQEQKYYYDMNNVQYEYMAAIFKNGKYQFISRDDYDDKDIRKRLKNKINVLHDSINDVGDRRTALSSSWFENPEYIELVKKLKKSIYNYFRNKVKAKSDTILWTTFKHSKSKLSGGGYTKGYVPCNARATNDYADKYNLAYCINVFEMPIIKQFFHTKGIKVDEDLYALSEMLQWIWRSRIRKGDSINIYIPSSRMRELLEKWMDGDI